MIPAPIADIADAAQWIVGIGGVLWIIQYTIYAKWWKNFLGRSIVLLAVSLLAIIGPSLATLVNPAGQYFTTTWYAYLETGSLLIATYAIVSRIVGWERLRRAREFRDMRHRRPDSGSSSPDRDARPED